MFNYLLYQYRISFLLVIISIFPVVLFAENTMKLIGGNVLVNREIEIKIDVDNDLRFISFQCDVILPDEFSYVEGTAILSDRANDHVMNILTLPNGCLRVFAYSLNNKPFEGDSGTITTFNLLVGNTEGQYDLIFDNVILGDSLSNNIVTDSVNGQVNVVISDIQELINDHFDFQFYPNPVSDKININFELTEPAHIEMFISNFSCGQELKKEFGNYQAGINSIVLNTKELFLSAGLYFIQIQAIERNNKKYQKVNKIIIVK